MARAVSLHRVVLLCAVVCAVSQLPTRSIAILLRVSIDTGTLDPDDNYVNFRHDFQSQLALSIGVDRDRVRVSAVYPNLSDSLVVKLELLPATWQGNSALTVEEMENKLVAALLDKKSILFSGSLTRFIDAEFYHYPADDGGGSDGEGTADAPARSATRELLWLPVLFVVLVAGGVALVVRKRILMQRRAAAAANSGDRVQGEAGASDPIPMHFAMVSDNCPIGAVSVVVGVVDDGSSRRRPSRSFVGTAVTEPHLPQEEGEPMAITTPNMEAHTPQSDAGPLHVGQQVLPAVGTHFVEPGPVIVLPQGNGESMAQQQVPQPRGKSKRHANREATAGAVAVGEPVVKPAQAVSELPFPQDQPNVASSDSPEPPASKSRQKSKRCAKPGAPEEQLAPKTTEEASDQGIPVGEAHSTTHGAEGPLADEAPSALEAISREQSHREEGETVVLEEEDTHT